MSHTVKIKLVLVGFFIMIFLHFDFWWFKEISPLVFGFMPIAMWFQVLVGGVVASVFLYFSYKVLWPEIPEDFEKINEEE